MKVAELREKLGKLKKEEVLKLAVEFYKLVPKAKKEDYDLDGLINNPTEKKSKTKRNTTSLSLFEIEYQVTTFIADAKEQNYISPNRTVPKKERATWRFKVKKWYKELINTKRPDADINAQAELLKKLYELLCESCRYQYFTAHDTFQSVGIDQSVFYHSVLELLQEVEGKSALINQGIGLIVDNYLNRYTLYSTLMIELISLLDIPDLKYQGIDKAKLMIGKTNFIPTSKKKRYSFSSNNRFEKERRNNNLTELVFRLYASLFEYDNAITFYEKNHYQRDSEIKLYILISLLLRHRQKDLILQEMEKAIADGIKPRENLLKLVEKIKTTGELPQYMR